MVGGVLPSCGAPPKGWRRSLQAPRDLHHAVALEWQRGGVEMGRSGGGLCPRSTPDVSHLTRLSVVPGVAGGGPGSGAVPQL